MKSVRRMLLCLAILGPSVASGADVTPEQILAKVSQTYRDLRSFRLVEQQESRKASDPALGGYEPSGPFGGRPARYTTDLASSSAGKIRLVVSSGEGEISLVSDGLKTWAYIPNLNEYTEADAAPLLQGLWRHPIHYISEDLARYRSLSREANHAKLRGEETLSLGGQEVRCYVVAVPARSGSRTLWIDEQRFIVLRDEWISPAGDSVGASDPDNTIIPDSGIWTSRLTKADLGPIADDVFRFAAPSGARRVDLFSAPAGPVEGAEEGLARLLIGSTMTHVVTAAQYASTYQRELRRGTSDLIGTEYVFQGTKAHDFTAGSLGGENVSLRGLHGKVVVLDFWASWCKPCQEELAAIQKLHDELASKGVVFLGIDDESSDTVQDFVKAHGYTFPMLLDSKQAVHGLYGVRCVPTTVVIDRKGKIAAHYVGAGGEAQLRRALKSAGLNTTP